MRWPFACLAILPVAGCTYYETLPPPPLTEPEIVRLTQEGTAPEEIIERIRESRAVYIMDVDRVLRLHESGVDKGVINYMIQTQLWDAQRRAVYYHPYYDPYCYPWYPYPPYPAGYLYTGPCW